MAWVRFKYKINNNNLMRKITQQIASAFAVGKDCQLSKRDSVRNGSLCLWGHQIAKFEDGQLMITNAGYFTTTTKDRLNGLNGVSIYQKNYDWFLTGKKWNGDWITV